MVDKVSISFLDLFHDTLCVVPGVTHSQDCANAMLTILNELAMVMVEDIRHEEGLFIVYFLHPGNYLLVGFKEFVE